MTKKQDESVIETVRETIVYFLEKEEGIIDFDKLSKDHKGLSLNTKSFDRFLYSVFFGKVKKNRNNVVKSNISDPEGRNYCIYKSILLPGQNNILALFFRDKKLIKELCKANTLKYKKGIGSATVSIKNTRDGFNSEIKVWSRTVSQGILDKNTAVEVLKLKAEAYIKTINAIKINSKEETFNTSAGFFESKSKLVCQ